MQQQGHLAQAQLKRAVFQTRPGRPDYYVDYYIGIKYLYLREVEFECGELAEEVNTRRSEGMLVP